MLQQSHGLTPPSSICTCTSK